MKNIALMMVSFSLIVLAVPGVSEARRHSHKVITKPTNSIPTTSPIPTAPVNTSASCTTGWYITGYFTPVESDYSGTSQTVSVSGRSYSFTSAFLQAVQTEGWGKTHLGNYIGYYDGSWHFSNAPLDAHDHALRVDTVAVDPSVIAFGKKVSIQNSLLTGKTFTATDIGNGVDGKHVDVYMGEGKLAEQQTYKITGKNQTVCVQ